jgi:DNA-binding response OmpR family regulator
VLDIMMPKLDGYETCKLLKAETAPRHSGDPAVGEGPQRGSEDRFEVGADDYITKPFSPRKLVERINAISVRRAAAHAGLGPPGTVRARVHRILRGPAARAGGTAVRSRLLAERVHAHPPSASCACLSA